MYTKLMIFFVRSSPQTYLLLLSLAVLPVTGCGGPDASAVVPASEAPAARISPLTVMTYNVQCALCNLERPWMRRLADFSRLIGYHAPDLIAAQELIIPLDAEHFRASLTTGAQAAAGVAYGSICRVNCDSTIYYRIDRFELEADGAVWLSSWPYRYAAWAVLRQRSTGAMFLFVNAHFDNHQPNQERSAKILAGALEPWLRRGLPVILAGDFNSSPGGVSIVHEGHQSSQAGYEVLASFLTNAYDLTARCDIFTNHADADSNQFTFDHLIDHIFVGPGGWSIQHWGIDYWWGMSDLAPRPFYPSDHWPIIARLQFEPGRPAAQRSAKCAPRITVRD